MESLKTIKYKGHEIEVCYDDSSMYGIDFLNEGKDGVNLVFYHRDFYITQDDIITKEDVKEYLRGNKIEQGKDYFIFPVSALIHGGVWLSLNDYFMEDPGGWDTSTAGVILVSRKLANKVSQATKIAQEKIKVWNDLLSGRVYCYSVDGNYSCGGYIGDDSIKDLIDDAKKEVDLMFRHREKKVKDLIRHKVDLYKRMEILKNF